MIRKHTESIRPPRALSVNFELGRPFGAPNEPEFQRKVLLEALKLLQRTDGPLIEDFIETPPNLNLKDNAMQGWACPINLEATNHNLGKLDKPVKNLKQEVALIKPWYNESIKQFNGRRLDGLTNFSPEEIIDFLINFVNNPDLESFMPAQSIGRALKLVSDDLKFFYFQAAMARPGNISDIELNNWFYGETLSGKLLIRIRKICLRHDNKSLQIIGATNFVPNAMLKHV